MKHFSTVCVGAVLACQAVQASSASSCKALVQNDNTFAEYDSHMDNTLELAQVEEENVNLA
jgi:hypothetical protein